MDSDYGSYKCARYVEVEFCLRLAIPLIISEDGESGSFGRCIPLVIHMSVIMEVGSDSITCHVREMDVFMPANTMSYIHPNSVGYDVGSADV